MMTCICKNNHVQHYDNFKGSHKPSACSICKQELYPAKWVYPEDATAGHYEPVVLPKRPATKLIICPVCGKRRRAPSSNVKCYPAPVVVEGGWIKPEDKWVRSEHRIEPGQYVCWFHELVTPQK